MAWEDSQKELDCLGRARLWEGLIGFCEEMDDAGGGDLSTDVGCKAMLQKARKTSSNDRKTRKTSSYDPKTMSKAVARDLGLI